jgi:type I restriction-modification system DNA methylase subunit
MKITEKKSKPKEIKSDMSNLVSIFTYCLDQMRQEHLTGDDALRNLAYLLVLRMLEPRFEKEIDIDHYPYEFSFEDPEDKIKIKLLTVVRFSNLAKENQSNIANILKLLWDEILSVHPKTNKIFMRNGGFDIKNEKTFFNIISKLSSFTFETIKEDILGEAYEQVIKDVMVGRTLGQYFTPPNVKQMMIQLIDPQIQEDGKIETIFDPAMGTGGFLLSSYRYYMDQSKKKQIPIDYEFMVNGGLSGREAHSYTFQLAISNMLISSGLMFDSLEHGDSIKNAIQRKYKIVLANPPFGIKGLEYLAITDPNRDQYMPIKINNAVCLFLQLIISILEINGRCAVVMPNGKETCSKTDQFVLIRKYLMKTCDLKQVILLPGKVFTHTSIETCVFYFEKKFESSNVLQIKDKKTSKTSQRSYRFIDEHATQHVQFYEFDAQTNEKKMVIEVPIDQIVKNSYSLNHKEYVEETPTEVGIETKTLSEIATFSQKSKRKASYGKDDGLYPFFTSSSKVNKFVHEPDYNEESLIIGSGGNANIKYGVKFSCSGDNFILKIKEGIMAKYVYYYLLNNIEILERGFVGVGLKHISKEYIQKMKIPIYPIEQQMQIVEYCENMERTNNELENQIKRNKTQAKLYIQEYTYHV